MSDLTEKNEVKPLGVDGLPWPQTSDVKIWTNEFCSQNPIIDHNVMIGWFTGTMISGYNLAKSQSKTEVCCGDFENCQKACVPLVNYWKEKNK
ncbi:MAG: hypothetical protein ACD_33C00002G0011 [uncultured bacterium]|nr:MAG: hypothetical protein ACD_33C00002G0011 [uncultured bacterium]